MRICVILEGCYPYITGGVSSWMHQYIKAMPEHEFVVWTILADEKQKGVFRYTLPENVVEVCEICLTEVFQNTGGKNVKLSPAELDAMEQLICCGEPDWELLFALFQETRCSPAGYLMSEQFMDVMLRLCKREYPGTAFADFFYTVRSMLLPLFFVLSQRIPEADVYHSIATGYAGILARMGSWRYRVPSMITEHGIYTREREEEILRSRWVHPDFKRIWVRFFYMLSNGAYETASAVTSLFRRAMETQIEMRCDAGKCRVVFNGVDEARFLAIGPKRKNGFIDIGAVLRIAPIKDVLTLIYAFSELKARIPNTRLFIAGPEDDPEYAKECRALIEQLGVRDIAFLGTINVLEYLGTFDFTVLTSISEGQPLSVLESFAAGRPVVATDVGCCKDLLYGVGGDDDLGRAGLCAPPMQSGLIAAAMASLCQNEEERLRMGRAGRERVNRYFRHRDMVRNYRELYDEVLRSGGTINGGNRV